MEDQNQSDKNAQAAPRHQPGDSFQPAAQSSAADSASDSGPDNGSSTPSPAQQPVQVQPLKKKLPKWRTWLLAVLGVILLGGAGTFAYFGYYLPNQPENVLGKAMRNFLLADSFSYSGKADFKQGETVSNLEFKGAVDTGSGSLSDFWLDSKISYSPAVIDVKLRGQDQKLYIKLNGVVDSGALLNELVGGENLEEYGLDSGVGQFFSSIEDTWLVLDSAGLEAPAGQESNIPDSDKEKVFDILSGYEILTILSRKGSQTINNQQAEGYDVELNVEQLNAALEEIIRTDYEVLEFDESLAAGIGSGFDINETGELPDFDLAVWIYSDDKTLAMINVKASDEAGGLALDIAFDGYNQPVDVQVPAEAKSVEELFGSLLAP